MKDVKVSSRLSDSPSCIVADENDPTAQMQEIMKSKMNPYRNLGGFSQMGQLLGRGYGDNVAQLIIGLGAPAVMGGEENA